MAGKTESKKRDASTGKKRKPGTKKETKSRKRISYKEKYEAIKSQNDRCEDRLLRILAEFENMKKRAERERVQLTESANSGLILQILPVLDDLERSLKIKHKNDELWQGVDLIYQKLTKLLEDQGVTPIESTGKPFDVQYHDALLIVDKPGVESGIVVEEYEKGYQLHEKVLRHAKVIVSQ